MWSPHPSQETSLRRDPKQPWQNFQPENAYPFDPCQPTFMICSTGNWHDKLWDPKLEIRSLYWPRPTLLHQVTMLAMLKLKKRSRIDVGSLKPHTMRTSIVRMAAGYNYSISQISQYAFTIFKVHDPCHMPTPNAARSSCFFWTLRWKCQQKLHIYISKVTQIWSSSAENLLIYKHLHSFLWDNFQPHLSPPAETLYKLPKGEDMAPWQSNRDGSMFPKLVPHHWPSPIGNSMRRGCHHFCMVRHEQAPYHFSWGLAIKNLKKEHSWVVLAWKMLFLEIAWSQSMKS